MAIIGYLFTAAQLKALPRKHHKTLLNAARRLVRTSPEIRKVVKHDPKIHRILIRKLRPTYNRLKRK
jgi:hypothetical protein